jgi:hypothetical protein
VSDVAGGGHDTTSIGGGRAILSGVTILVIGIGASVWGSDYVLKHFTGLSRDSREYLASALFFAVVIVMAWGLRRLQQRGVI